MHKELFLFNDGLIKKIVLVCQKTHKLLVEILYFREKVANVLGDYPVNITE